MTNIFTDNFGVYVADQMESAFKSNTMFYTFTAKSTEYPNDVAPPEPGTSYQDQTYSLFDEMLFAKRITTDDVVRVIRNEVWVTETVYTQYDSNLQNPKDANFYVSTLESNVYSVFMCVDNNEGAESTIKPLKSNMFASDTLYRTSDGYSWKYMYSVGVSDFKKFGSIHNIPILEDVAVTANAVSGAIDMITVKHPGIDYKNFTSGLIGQVVNPTKLFISSVDNVLAANVDFYVGSALYITGNEGFGEMRIITEYGTESGDKYVIIDEAFDTTPSTASTFDISPSVALRGDGTGFRARAVVETGTTSIDRIEVIERGQNYTFGEAEVVGNSGTIDSNTGFAVFSSPAELGVIIPTVGGLGFDIEKDLFADKVSITTEFVGTEVPVVQFRKIGIIMSPTLDNIEVKVANTANFENGFGVITGDGHTGFVTGADHNQSVLTLSGITGALTDGVTLDVTEEFNDANTTIISIDTDYNRIDARTAITVAETATYQDGEMVVQGDNEGFVESTSGSIVYLTEVTGDFVVGQDLIGEDSNFISNISSIRPATIRDNTGQIIYIENLNPVQRQTANTESFKMVIQF